MLIEIIRSRDFSAMPCIYKPKSHWMKVLKLTKQNKTERKSKLQNKSKIYYWTNMSLLHKHPATEYEIEVFEWKKIIIEWNWYRNGHKNY